MMDTPTRLRSAALFASLGHPTRICIVELLLEKELSVGDICSSLELPQSNASQHLAALLRTGVLAVTPRGTSRMYRIRGPRITKILELIREFCDVQGLKGEPIDEHYDI